MRLSRRGLLAGAAVGGGLVVAWSLWPREFDTPLSPGRGEWAFGAWLKIAHDGVVTVAVPQLEMGQGITTLLPQLVAAELGADWRQIAVEPAPVSGAYANVPLAAKWAPLWMPMLPGLADGPDALLALRYAQEEPFNATAEGLSLAAFEGPAREAAAAARAMLVMAAAQRWGVAWEECDAHSGFVFHDGKQLSFAALAGAASRFSPPDPPPINPQPYGEGPGLLAEDETVPYLRLDLPAKVDGSYLFAGDVRLPNMIYAAIHHGPVGTEELTGFDLAAARKVRGLVQVVKNPRWIAALGETWWAAEQALKALKPRFKLSAAPDSDSIEQKLDNALLKGDAVRIATRGGGDAALGDPSVTYRYDIAPATHATLETASATARMADGRLELWVASQAPEHARRAAARAVGLSDRDVVIYPMGAGGSFDRRLEHDHAIEAAVLAQAAGRPVQLIWSRAQEAVAGRPRAPLACLASGWTAKENGTATGLRLRVAMPATVREFGKRLFDNKTAEAALRVTDSAADPLAFEGALVPYAIPDIAIDHVPVNVGLPSGRMRGNAHAYLAFAVECFVDELAKRVGREPLSYRMELLGEDPRLAECLQRAARLAQWDGGADKSGQGIACWRIGGDGGTGGSADPEAPEEAVARIACVATAHAGDGGVKVSKLAAAVDLGRIVNLDIARQQIEGGLLFGMSLATGSAFSYSKGAPTSGRLAGLALPRLGDAPEVTVEFIAGNGLPADPGEIGVAVAAPAIANALQSATDLRMRRLPLISEGI
ncbi:xanthine dehydrogenase family protein molybdopterin-binding subunit [Altererythrobacter sp. FM1]|uniref:molybdopterin cofactor-binding domain-containing protein n=1 Tax=Tsuneonella flava TaxID=2055955 RepID=UPI000C80C74A|nr:molybdopterin cofactor-binding domain-containing protein [Tsuneonella flava]ROT96556.1 xanthine dehydrogenase family protein molybdopterin-binding subunit [Altererythrobacter sp. FM1]